MNLDQFYKAYEISQNFWLKISRLDSTNDMTGILFYYTWEESQEYIKRYLMKSLGFEFYRFFEKERHNPFVDQDIFEKDPYGYLVASAGLNEVDYLHTNLFGQELVDFKFDLKALKKRLKEISPIKTKKIPLWIKIKSFFSKESLEDIVEVYVYECIEKKVYSDQYTVEHFIDEGVIYYFIYDDDGKLQ